MDKGFRMNVMFLFLAALFHAALAGAVLVAAVRRPKTRARKFAAVLAIFVLLSILSAITGQQILAQERAGVAAQAEQQKYREAAWAHFRKRCTEDAGDKIFQTVDNVEGIYVMRPRSEATTAELSDQYWLGDPYGYDGHRGFRSLLYAAKYKYVELPIDRDKGAGSQMHDRYRYEITGKATGYFGNSPQQTTREKVEIVGRRVADRKSRYGFTWEDMSTSEDRKYWVASGRIKVVDLETDQVIAEHTGFLIEPSFGAVGRRRPWEAARRPGNVCPEKNFVPYNLDVKVAFLVRVLKPAKGATDAK